MTDTEDDSIEEHYLNEKDSKILYEKTCVKQNKEIETEEISTTTNTKQKKKTKKNKTKQYINLMAYMNESSKPVSINERKFNPRLPPPYNS